MPLYQILSLVATAVIVLSGTAVNLFLIGRFVGQYSESMRALNATIVALQTRLEELELVAAQVPLLHQRLVGVEEAIKTFWDLRDAFTKLATTVELTSRQQAEQLTTVTRSIGSLERQITDLSTSRDMSRR